MAVKRSRRPCVAIDGPAGAGKSTVARELARTLGYVYVDTGAMYRAITLKALRAGYTPSDHTCIVRLAESTEIQLKPDPVTGGVIVFLDGEDVTRQIRSPEVNDGVSPVSAIRGVRSRMVALQRLMALQGGIVMEGRDIGTVVLPGADVKVFLSASQEERAKRRIKEMRASGYDPSEQAGMEDITRRDTMDSSRDVSPLVQADDAFLIDSSSMSITEVVETIAALVRRACVQDV
jgi:cytidylate kinase